MSQDTSIPEEGPPEPGIDEAPEHDDLEQHAEIERLTTLHAQRLKEIETDRWRQGERIEALEAQNAELQADFLEHTRALEKELTNTRKALDEQRESRRLDATRANQQENERVEASRREGQEQLKQLDARGERQLAQLLETKDQLAAQAMERQASAARQHSATLEQLAELRRELSQELAAQRQQTSDALAETARTKNDLVARHEAHGVAMSSLLRELRELERAHGQKLLDEAERRARELAEQRQGFDAELSRWHERLIALTLREQTWEADTRQVRDERDSLTERLVATQTEQQELVSRSETALSRAEQLESELARLRAAQHEALEAAQKQAETLAEELSLLRQEHSRRSETASTTPSTGSAQDQHQDDAEVQRLRQTAQALERDVVRYREAAVQLEHRVEQTKDTLSFRLGHLLIHSPKSWGSLKRLPQDLLALSGEAKRRRLARSTPHAPAKRPLEQPLSAQAEQLLLSEGPEAAVRFIEFGAADDRERASAFTQLAKALKSGDPVAATRLATRAYDLEPLPFRAKWLAFAAFDAGELERPAMLLRSLPENFALKASEKARVSEIMGLSRLKERLPQVPNAATPAYTPLPGSTLYVAASALPFHVSGYTVRTQAILRALANSDLQVTAALRPGYPADRGIDLAGSQPHHSFDGVRYTHVPGPHVRRTGLDHFVEAAALGLMEVAKQARVELIHAASNHVNALPALLAARRLGIPFVYEVRGMWELTAATRNQDWESSQRFALERDLETLVASQADAVLTLTRALADELIGRGVPAQRLTVVPNAVDPKAFAPRRKEPEMMLRFGLNASAFTLVYAGSLLHYEGLDDLVRAVAMLTDRNVDVTLVIAGEGEAAPGLAELARELKLDRRVKLIGKLAPTEIAGLWSVADAAAFPRKPFRVCELVSPLKPLEPMAMGIPVVVSDVAALREMVTDAETGLWHRAGDVRSLADQLERLAR